MLKEEWIPIILCIELYLYQSRLLQELLNLGQDMESTYSELTKRYSNKIEAMDLALTRDNKKEL